jgi:hypothetical protein
VKNAKRSQASLPEGVKIVDGTIVADAKLFEPRSVVVAKIGDDGKSKLQAVEFQLVPIDAAHVGPLFPTSCY